MKNDFEWLRLMTPLGVTVCLFLMGLVLARMDRIEDRTNQSYEIVSNRLQHELLEIKQRLSVLETKINYIYQGHFKKEDNHG